MPFIVSYKKLQSVCLDKTALHATQMRLLKLLYTAEVIVMIKKGLVIILGLTRTRDRVAIPLIEV